MYAAAGKPRRGRKNADFFPERAPSFRRKLRSNSGKPADGRREGVGMGNRPEFPMPLAKVQFSEGHDTASHFALDEVIIRLVDLGERIFPGEKFVEL